MAASWIFIPGWMDGCMDGGAVRARRRGAPVQRRPLPNLTAMEYGCVRPSIQIPPKPNPRRRHAGGRYVRDARAAEVSGRRARKRNRTGCRRGPAGPGRTPRPHGSARRRQPICTYGGQVCRAWPRRRRIGEMRKTRARAISEVKCARHVKLLFNYTPSYSS
jgi:hypothetical protein